MRPFQISYTFLACFILTISFLRWYQYPSYPDLIFQILGTLGILGILGIPKKISRPYAAFALAGTLGISLALTAVARTTHSPSDLTVDTYATEQYVTILGHIATEPDRRPLQTKYTIEAEQMRTASGTIIFPIHGKVLVSDHSGYPQYAFGDTVNARGTLEKPGAIETFRYDRYLSRYSVYSVIYRASLERTAQGKPTILGSLFAFKEGFESQINRLLPEPHASFMAGLLTGSRKGIPKEVLDTFQRTGLTHIIAISGYNITIVITLIAGMLFWLPLKWRFIPSVTAIVAFTIFVGASAAVVRAAIMGILGLLALQMGRLTHIRLAVLWTACFMLLWNPKLLWYDAGFQLSFLAVIGITELTPMLQSVVRYAPKTLGIREALTATLAAQLTAVPLSILLFGSIPIFSLVANILVAPAIPLAMLLGALGTGLSYLWFPLGQILHFLAWGCMEWIILVADTLSRLPYATVNWESKSIALLLTYYALLFGWIAGHNQLVRRKIKMQIAKKCEGPMSNVQKF